MRAAFTSTLFITTFALGLTACQLEHPFADNKPEPEKPKARTIQSLAPVDNDERLLEFLRDGLIATYGFYEEGGNYCQHCTDDGIGDIAVEENSPVDGSADNGSSKESEPSSETNLIEAGVDEADWLKYDKDNGLLFYSIQPQWYGGWYDVFVIDDGTTKSSEYIEPEKARGKIDVFQLESTGTHAAISSYALGEHANHIQGLYTTGEDQLLALYSKSEPHNNWYEPYYWSQGKVAIEAINTEDSNQLKQDWQLEIDGYLVDSRRIENQLYLVTRFEPQIKGLRYSPWDKAVVENNKKLIANAQLNELLPSLKLTQGDKQNSQLLMPSSRCLIPSDTDLGYGYSMLTSITRVNLDDPSDWQSSCAIAPLSQIYMNQDALYLLRGYYWDEPKTELHRFALENLSYTDSTVVPGSMGRRSQKFRIKEQTLNEQKTLTVITSTRNRQNWRDWQHKLFNYAVSETGELELIATLPNETQPKAIGKPEENIYGVRIEGGKVYIVTFEQKDPLYNIDISDPANPEMLGELEIPGFSDYLHPVNDDLLIGVGYQTENGNRYVKVSLYDVSSDNPTLVSEKLIGGDGWMSSDATWDHHAFNYLDYNQTQNNGKYRFTVPTSGVIRIPNTYNYLNKTALHLFEISTLDGAVNDISQAPELLLDQPERHYYGGNSARAVLIGDSIHFADQNLLASAMWQTPNVKQQSMVQNDKPPVYVGGHEPAAID